LLKDYFCFGVELNEAAFQLAQNKGITMLSEPEFEGFSDPGFDAIVLSDVFEHLPNPTELLRTLSRKLRPQGMLLLSTGNADAKACRKDIPNFWYFRTPEHLCMLNRDYVNYLSRSLNLKLVVWEETCHYEMKLHEFIKQRMQSLAYWSFHNEGSTAWSILLRTIPPFRKARNWSNPPALTCTKDHVVVGLQNQE
jgi:SAM-dependent methyltransferase